MLSKWCISKIEIYSTFVFIDLSILLNKFCLWPVCLTLIDLIHQLTPKRNVLRFYTARLNDFGISGPNLAETSVLYLKAEKLTLLWSPADRLFEHGHGICGM